LHKSNYIHRDVKPANFLIGLGKKKNIIHLIDFGLSKRYRNAKTGTHIPYNDNKNFTGTVRFASINSHLGIEQSRRDDIESLGYMLIYFLRGSLPWQGIKAGTRETKADKVMRFKVSVPIKTLCQDLPPEFGKIIRYAKDMKFEQGPDYSGLRKSLKELYYKEELYKEDLLFDWQIQLVF